MPEENKDPEQTEEVRPGGAIFSNSGIPFKTEQAAKITIRNKKLDPNQFTVKSFEDGFIILPKAVKVEGKYYRVTFGHKTSPTDDEDVTLTVNGETLVIKRGAPVIIPERFKECADHAQYPQFTQRPNEPRKIVGYINTFPYSGSGEASKKEYLVQLSEGNKTAKEAAEKVQKLLDS